MILWRAIKFGSICLMFGGANAHAAPTTSEIKYDVQRRALTYFVEQSNPRTGLTLDQADNFGQPRQNDSTTNVASIAATGFSLTVIAHAAERGWLDESVAFNYSLKTLRFAKRVARHKGWFAHFVDDRTGARVWQSEYSTIDTALFIAGALYAGSVFRGTEVDRLAHELYDDMDFHEMLTDGGAKPSKLTLSMGYLPELGFIPAQWDMYAEQAILLLLGLGHPTRPIPASAWRAFSRAAQHGIMGYDQALFVHQYSQLYIDFRDLCDGFPNYFENSVRLTHAQRRIAAGDVRYETYKKGFWGFSAGLAPESTYEVASATAYRSTACIGCIAASAMFTPALVIKDLKSWLTGPYRDVIWGRYGLVDSIDLDKSWAARRVLGITVGAAYISFANINGSSSIWARFMRLREVQNAVKRAQLVRGRSVCSKP